MSLYYINYNKLDGGSDKEPKIDMTEEKISTEYRKISFYELLDLCYEYKMFHYVLNLVLAIYKKDERFEIKTNGSKILIKILIPTNAESEEGEEVYLNLSNDELDNIFETFIVNNILFFEKTETLIDEINGELLKISQFFLKENLKKEQNMEEISEILNNFLEDWHFHFYIFKVFAIFQSKDKFKIKFDKITKNVDIIMNLILYNTAKFFEICLTKINEFNLKYSYNITNESNENSLLKSLIEQTIAIITNVSQIGYGGKININDSHRKIFKLFLIFFEYLREIESDILSKSKQNEIKRNKDKLFNLIKTTADIIMTDKSVQGFDFIYQIFRSITNAIMNILINRKYIQEFSKIYEELIKYEGLLNPNIIEYFLNLEKQAADILKKILINEEEEEIDLIIGKKKKSKAKYKKKEKEKEVLKENSDSSDKSDQTQENSDSSDKSDEVGIENDYKELIKIDISNQITRFTSTEIASNYIQFDDEIISLLTYIGINIFLKNDIDLDFFVHNFYNNGIDKIFKSYNKNFERLAILIEMINKNEIISENIKEKFYELLNNIAGRHNFLVKFSLISDNFSDLGFKDSKLTRQISDWEYSQENTNIIKLKKAIDEFNDKNNGILKLKLKIKKAEDIEEDLIEYILIGINDDTEDHFTFHTDLESYNKIIGRVHLKFGKQYFKYLYVKGKNVWRIVERKKIIDLDVFKEGLNENQRKLVDFINDTFFEIIELNLSQ